MGGGTDPEGGTLSQTYEKRVFCLKRKDGRGGKQRSDSRGMGKKEKGVIKGGNLVELSVGSVQKKSPAEGG